jgi:hypothetical protein
MTRTIMKREHLQGVFQHPARRWPTGATLLAAKIILEDWRIDYNFNQSPSAQ